MVSQRLHLILMEQRLVCSGLIILNFDVTEVSLNCAIVN
uniref:Uncharacterized protein n=1 Tax=Setaria italica TaxID=4555 RepID=K4ANQ1_SETIT